MGALLTCLRNCFGWFTALIRWKDPNENEENQRLLDGDAGPVNNTVISISSETRTNEKRCRELVAEGICSSMEKARIGMTLLLMGYEENRAISVANRCRYVDEALVMLNNECTICTDVYDQAEMFAMLFCTHKCCTGCAKQYFSNRIREGSVRDIVCPFCFKPDLSDIGFLGEYFGYMSHYLERILDKDVFEILQWKLCNAVVDEDPDSWHCPQCDFCCFVDPRDRQVLCRKCGTEFCTRCKSEPHLGFSCEQFAKWKAINDPEAQPADLNEYLDENGIDCPNCKSRFDLSKGGCMHFKCLVCKHEFCSGCHRPFVQGNECNVSENCKQLGLHSHHPRNCLFYLRDYDVHELENLLRRSGVVLKHTRRKIKRNFKSNQEFAKECNFMIEKETKEGLKDEICGAVVANCETGLCRLHYLEYLTSFVRKHSLDPASIMQVNELITELTRNQKAVPERRFDERETAYKMRLINLVKHEIPLLV